LNEVTIVYQFIALYRSPIFDELSKSKENKYIFACDIKGKENIQTVDNTFFDNKKIIFLKNYWFNNLLMPFIGESIMNFGYIGIILYPIILAYVFVFFQKWFYSNSFLKKTIAVYFAFHLMFLLRGDFTNGFSYFIGTFIAIYLIPKTLNLFFIKGLK
jgi:hypothetical protein